MKARQAIYTQQAPTPLGAYSQAIKAGNTVYLSGQIPIEPATGNIITMSIDAQVHQVFKNLAAVIEATGGCFADIVKLTIFLTDLSHFPIVNAIMEQYFTQPYPARSTIGVAALPKGVNIEIEGVLVLAA
jgi:reactive intermediate/imine deaminase